MFQRLKILPLLLFLSVVFSCRSDSRENSRAYIEGKVLTTPANPKSFVLKIVSNKTIVAETTLEAEGNFKLSGPVNEGDFSLISTERIQSFTSDKSGLMLSADGFRIEIPAGNTYIKFKEIVLAQ
ncbi:MAG: hypothetical protein ACOH1X_06775 [Kaistella sp.]